MATEDEKQAWLYQLSHALWAQSNYRVNIWEGETCDWSIHQHYGEPKSGDTVFFYYAKAATEEHGFFGWAP